MKWKALTIASFLGLAVGVLGPGSAPADAHAHIGVGLGYGYGYGYGYSYPGYPYYPYNYYPNYYYPYEYYTPHAPHYYPYYYPYGYSYPSYLSCYTVITNRVYWKNGQKYVVRAPVRTCYRVRSY
jgi:hypothetical protein